MVLMNLFAGQRWRHRHREQMDTGQSRGRRGWDKWRELHGNMYITICKMHGRWEFAVCLSEPKAVLCDNLKGWDGVGGGREFQEEGDICIPMADSC